MIVASHLRSTMSNKSLTLFLDIDGVLNSDPFLRHQTVPNDFANTSCPDLLQSLPNLSWHRPARSLAHWADLARWGAARSEARNREHQNRVGIGWLAHVGVDHVPPTLAHVQEEARVRTVLQSKSQRRRFWDCGHRRISLDCCNVTCSCVIFNLRAVTRRRLISDGA
jgi:hypothetical protein